MMRISHNFKLSSISIYKVMDCLETYIGSQFRGDDFTFLDGDMKVL